MRPRLFLLALALLTAHGASVAAGSDADAFDLPLPGGTLQFATAPGLTWHQMTDNNGTALLAAEGAKPVFCLDENGARLTSADFQVVRREKDGGRGEVLVLENAENGWRARFSAAALENGAALLGLELENLRDEERRPQVTFPILGPATLGGDMADVSYFYPWRTGIVGKVDCRLSHEYGSLAWMQVVSVFSPRTGRGLYLFPRDSSGLFKSIQFRKGSAQRQGFVRHTESVLSHLEPRFPLDFREGAGVAYSYLPRPVPAKGRLAFPSAEIGFAPGGWKDALKAYGTWARTWFKKVPTPQWFDRSFVFNPAHPYDFWSAKEKRYIQGDKIDPRSDVVQWFKWEQYKENPDPATQLSQLADTQPGDFQYNTDRGGLKAFREEIRKIQSKGTRFTVYIDHRFCWKETETGKTHGEQWAAMYAPGSFGYYTSPEDKWMMPLYGKDRWVNYLAGVCARVIRDTGMDGIYLDELNIAFPDFHSDRAAEYGPEAPVPVPLLAQAVTKIRDAMQKENPEAVLYVEHAGSDYMAQFTDGSWMQTFYDKGFPFAFKHYDEDSLVYFRFVFPEFKLAQWGDSGDGPNRCFFNGIGSPYHWATDFYTILHENADAFTGLQPEPLVATTRDRLLANRFPAGEKVVYTLYNKTGQAVDEDALRVERRDGRHYVDLRAGRNLAGADNDDGRRVRVQLEPGEVTAIADLPRLIEAERTPDGLKFKVLGDTAGRRLVYGSTPSADAGSLDLAAPEGVLPLPSGPAHVKLTKDGILEDWWIRE